jgi:hypothetical protein
VKRSRVIASLEEMLAWNQKRLDQGETACFTEREVHNTRKRVSALQKAITDLTTFYQEKTPSVS